VWSWTSCPTPSASTSRAGRKARRLTRERVPHVVWDWNGTLFADAGALIESTIDAFRGQGLPPVDHDRYRTHYVQPIPLFYDRLAGRILTPAEQRALAHSFREAYLQRLRHCVLTADAIPALLRWSSAGGRQSLLSMYPHDELMALAEGHGIAQLFERIDGIGESRHDRKERHLADHLARLGVEANRVVVIGDSLDDAISARAIGAGCILYEGGLHQRTAIDAAGVPVVTTLLAAVDLLVSAIAPS
jgi:phosphoglycolate phosphatase-like HAD superfamily hydrolase